MSIFRRAHTIIIHSGRFHTDEVFAVAALELAFGAAGRPADFRIIRTRDERILAKGADFVVDVGGVYDPARRLFDHHQAGGAGKRPGGIPYAAFGLVWKSYGRQACMRAAGLADADSQSAAATEDIAARVDAKLVAPIDAIDNGISLMTPVRADALPYELDDLIDAFLPIWDEKNATSDSRFADAVRLAADLLSKEIARAAGKRAAAAHVEAAYQAAADKRLVIFDGRYPWKETILAHPEPLFIVGPDPENGTWGVRAVPLNDHSFANRADLPAAWAGKRDAELAAVTGVPDALFCHNGRFLAGATSREGAVKLAELALAQVVQ